MFGVKAQKILPSEDPWLTRTQHGLELSSEHVVVATGLNRVSKWPSFEGEEGFTGRRIHARGYRDPGPFAGQRVLVVRMGNTGPKSRSISARREWIRPFRCGARSTSSPVTSWAEPPN